MPIWSGWPFAFALLDDRLRAPSAEIGCGGFGWRQPRIRRLHLLPDVVRDGDRVAVQVDAERRDHVRPSCRCRCVAPIGWPASMCAPSSSPRDHAIEQDLPVGLRLERDVELLLLEEAELLRDHERRAVGELDEAELELVLLRRRGRCAGRGPEREQQSGGRRFPHSLRTRPPKSEASGRARDLRARSDAVVRTFECRSGFGAQPSPFKSRASARSRAAARDRHRWVGRRRRCPSRGQRVLAERSVARALRDRNLVQGGA